MSSGKIAQVVGPVVDVAFATGDKLPEINNALVVYTDEEKSRRIVLEVALELGEGVVRTIAMESTDGLTRGLEVLDTGRPISVPVGKETLGRVFNVLGDTIDMEAPFADVQEHRPEAPSPSPARYCHIRAGQQNQSLRSFPASPHPSRTGASRPALPLIRYNVF